MPNPLQWASDDLLRIDDVEFHLATATQEMLQYAPKPGQFLLAKTRWMVEVGILHGGSTALYAKLFEPEKLAAIDMSTVPVDALTDFIRDHGFEGRIRPYYGVDQADEQKMGRILASDFPEQNIDLVVDDASHLYFETRKTFNLALPYLRPDGLARR